MPLYNVEVTIITTLVVDAQNEKDANAMAEKHWKEDWDYKNFEVSLQGEVKSREDLHDGWDEHCLPYGGNKKINEYFKK